MPALTLASALDQLAWVVRDAFTRQIMDPLNPDYGAHIRPDWGIADPSHVGTTRLLAACGYLWLAPAEARPPQPDRATLLARAHLAADYLLRAQHPTGLIDLLDCNYDSSPDTGFAVQQLCTLIELGQAHTAHYPDWAALLHKVETFIRRAVPGMLAGGFHTPNHRWVIASALVQAAALFPDLDVRATVDAYLAEGFDLDAEGTFLERSVGVYDAVTDRSLLILADHGGVHGAREAVHANLVFNLHLLHADGTAETGLSRRQDYGTRRVPLPLIATYLYSNALDPNPEFVRAAQHLWTSLSDLLRPEGHDWLAYILLRFGEPAPSEATLPDSFSRFYPINGLWRVRRGPLSASFFRDVTRLMTLSYGQAEIASLKISQSYFGIGRFIANSLEPQDGGGVLHATGQFYRRPGYEQPLGRPVPRAEWESSRQERGLRLIPPATSELRVHEIEDGFTMRYVTLDGAEGATAQVALDFPAGGVWETEDTAVQPRAGQVLFLKHGYGAMRYGPDVIEIGPGADGHRMWQMRETETAPDHVRVLLTFRTPVDHSFTIRLRHGL